MTTSEHVRFPIQECTFLNSVWYAFGRYDRLERPVVGRGSATLDLERRPQ